MIKYECVKLNPQQFNKWDDYVEQHRFGTIFHKTSWLKLISTKLDVFVAQKDGLIIGGVALIQSTNKGVKGYHIPPYSMYFSPLTGYPSSNKIDTSLDYEIVKDLLRIIPRFGHIDFTFQQDDISMLPYYLNGFQIELRLTHKIDTSFPDYLKNLNKNKLRDIRKVERLVKKGDLKVETKINIESFLTESTACVRKYPSPHEYMK